MTQKCLERNFAWTNQVELWASAFAVNPNSAHTCHNYAINLSLKGDLRQAIKVLEHARGMDELDKVDSDEIYPTLALCPRQRSRVEFPPKVLQIFSPQRKQHVLDQISAIVHLCTQKVCVKKCQTFTIWWCGE